MLAFGVKLVWFVLSLSGLIGCWAVLLPLARAIHCYWAPLVYAVGITALDGVFCLGLIWRLDPAKMPKAFCLTQVFVTGCATFLVVGLLAAITTWTFMYVAKPKQWGSDAPVLPWQYYYLLPMLLYPLLASAVHVTVVIYFNTFQPFDGFACIVQPAWIRFLGFAGPPFLVTIPSLCLSIISTYRVWRTHRHIRRARRSINFDELADNFTALPQRRKSRPSLKPPSSGSTPPTPYAITAPSPTPSSRVRMSKEVRRQPINPTLRHERIRSFHLPFVPPSPVASLGRASSRYVTASSGHGHHSHDSEDSFDTVSSVAFAEIEVVVKSKSKMTPPRFLLTAATTRDRDAVEDAEMTTPLRSLAPTPSDTPSGTTRSTNGNGRSVHNSDRISITQIALELRNALASSEGTEYYLNGTRTTTTGDDEDEEEEDEYDMVAGSDISKSPTPATPQHRKPPELPSLIRSLLIFQFAIIAIHFLCAITPLVDLATPTPAAIGTQHVALLLAGWAPVFIFAPLSDVQRQIWPWRR
ncbi:hypothetical protein FB45DRAFT_1054395 [Roridomyces roridus]|uniref:Uncharacterized protein n=1 Tax=Roridomyces roridus TaxID=1738132 RepID=A0AAD7C932_9AGAR|nr:hypothetical protein FB45DRAFT_1054395 [Roridomyces roridus]